jgi:hypothetical protein
VSEGDPTGVAFVATPAKGLADLAVSFEYRASSPVSILTIALDYEGDGQPDFVTNDLDAPLMHTYQAGAFAPEITIEAIEGTFRASVAVEAEVAADVDARFQQIWSALNATLVAGDKEGALQFLNVHARPRFEPVWTAILTDPNNMSELVAGFLGFQPLSVGQDIAVYALRTTENGEARVYLVTFLRGEDGVWRLAEM